VVVTFDAELWIWETRRADTWIFVSLPARVSEEIRDLAAGQLRGFGSLRVRAAIRHPQSAKPRGWMPVTAPP
jgi:hypothetical protein